MDTIACVLIILLLLIAFLALDLIRVLVKTSRLTTELQNLRNTSHQNHNLYNEKLKSATEELEQRFSVREKELINQLNISKKQYTTREKELIAQLNDAKCKYSLREQELITQLNDEKNQYSIREQELIHQLNYTASIVKSNLIAIPYYSQIIADYDTRGLDILAEQLNWGENQKRLQKVKSILEIKKDTAELIASYKAAEYQLAYAIRMFPALEDFLDSEYSSDMVDRSLELLTSNHDNVRNFLSKEEYTNLSVSARNQLALDRYWESHRRSKWQVGRDYEQYIGYRYSMKGYKIQYYGIEKGREDLGRDIIAKKNGQVLIIQCKYWSSKKHIHEKHINQLYGTMAEYCFEYGLDPKSVHGILVTNITFTSTAKRFSKYLSIEAVENIPLGKYPCIKCNINKTNNTRIYHLPFDQQYDSCKIDSAGEFYAMTVAEAEAKGFRRAYRWHNTD